MCKRKVDVRAGNEWKRMDFKELKKGNIFRIYEPPDYENTVTDRDGNSVFIALDNPFIQQGRYTIKFDPYQGEIPDDKT